MTHVTNSGSSGCLGHFVTLVTDMKNQAVTPVSIKPSRVSRMSREKNDGLDKIQRLAIEWLEIVLKEGHIEPSQPCVGRVIGWPSRRFRIQSLVIDFTCWCRRHKNESGFQDTEAFIRLLDLIFIRNGEAYDFPPLEECRQIFLSYLEGVKQ